MKYDPHAVYLMKNRWSDANYKLGFSRRPAIRKVEVDHDYSVDPHLLAVCWLPTEKDARAAERIWHSQLAHLRTDDHGGREWFSLSETHVHQFCSWCEHSLDFQILLDDLFSGRMDRSQIHGYSRLLIKSIPKSTKPPRDDVWLSPMYLNNLTLSNDIITPLAHLPT
jgi:hypothetical protein